MDLPNVSIKSFVIERPAANGTLIHATDDRSAIESWLQSSDISPQTYSSYRKEAYRMLLWTQSQQMTFADLAYDDTLKYENFLLNPPDDWIEASGKFPLGHEKWKPFHGPLSKSSARLSMIIVKTMFSWMMSAKYLKANPMSLRKLPKKKKTRLERFFTPTQVGYILDTIESMPDTDSNGKHIFNIEKHRARSRWVFCLLYLTMLRISEACAISMGDFKYMEDGNGKGRWWLQVTGKGNVEADIPVASELLGELSKYRAAMGISPPLPTEYEAWPVVMRIEGDRTTHITRSSLHLIVKTIFTMAADKLENEGHPERANKMRTASAHWMRHAGGSAIAKAGADITEVRDMMRHANVATTSIYMHNDQEKLHDVAEKVMRLPV